MSVSVAPSTPLPVTTGGATSTGPPEASVCIDVSHVLTPIFVARMSEYRARVVGAPDDSTVTPDVPCNVTAPSPICTMSIGTPAFADTLALDGRNTVTGLAELTSISVGSRRSALATV